MSRKLRTALATAAASLILVAFIAVAALTKDYLSPSTGQIIILLWGWVTSTADTMLVILIVIILLRISRHRTDNQEESADPRADATNF